jgi:hypothetical protein
MALQVALLWPQPELDQAIYAGAVVLSGRYSPWDREVREDYALLRARQLLVKSAQQTIDALEHPDWLKDGAEDRFAGAQFLCRTERGAQVAYLWCGHYQDVEIPAWALVPELSAEQAMAADGWEADG